MADYLLSVAIKILRIKFKNVCVLKTLIIKYPAIIFHKI